MPKAMLHISIWEANKTHHLPLQVGMGGAAHDCLQLVHGHPRAQDLGLLEGAFRGQHALHGHLRGRWVQDVFWGVGHAEGGLRGGGGRGKASFPKPLLPMPLERLNLLPMPLAHLHLALSPLDHSQRF